MTHEIASNAGGTVIAQYSNRKWESTGEGVSKMAWGILITMLMLFGMMGMAMFEAMNVDKPTKRDTKRKSHTRMMKKAA